ncbi:acyl carrier protein [Kitasatospora azatica]|uniref:acyl carrier protein n=1 Tax=Kitasatospora azatica TaxID=58347 RepID=UPI0005648DA8|nr:acyl carrier protein [Kitasatospora azatica]
MTDRHTHLFADLRSILVEELRILAPDIDPAASVLDLGLDSLARMELSVALDQRLGIALPAQALRSAETLGDIVALMDAQSAG